jgi:hypothetical protein
MLPQPLVVASVSAINGRRGHDSERDLRSSQVSNISAGAGLRGIFQSRGSRGSRGSQHGLQPTPRMPATCHDSAKHRLDSSSANQLCAEDLDDLDDFPSFNCALCASCWSSTSL